MKNKKLFAILTLVCFMFTLMPVAAFAADAYTLEATQNTATGNVTVEVYKNGALDTTFVGGLYPVDTDKKFTASTAVATIDKGVGTIPAASVTAVASYGIETGLTLNVGDVADATVAITAEMVAYAKAKTNTNVDPGESTIATVKSNVEADVAEYVDVIVELDKALTSEKLVVWAEKTNDVASKALAVVGATEINDSGIFQVAAGKNIELKVAFTAAGTYKLHAAIVTDAQITAGLDIDSIDSELRTEAGYNTIVVEADNLDSSKFTMDVTGAVTDTDVKDSEVVAGKVTVKANGVDEKTVTLAFEDVDGNAVVGYTVEISTNSSAIEVSKTTAVTNYKGEITFDVSGTIEGDYEIDIICEDFDATINVTVGSTSAAYIEFDAAPKAPQALYGKMANDAVTFVITDINGNIVDAIADGGMDGINGNGSTGKYIVLTEKPAKSDLKSKDLSLVYDAADGVWGIKGIDKDAEGDYAVKVILDNGSVATAEWTVKKFQTPVKMYFNAGVPAQVELGREVTPQVKYVDANGVEKNATSEVEIAATGYAIQKVYDNAYGMKTFALKTDEKYVGSEINVTAVSDKYDLACTTTVKIVEVAGITFTSEDLDVNVNNKIDWMLADENGKVVRVNNVKDVKVSAIVVDQPEGSKVSVNAKADTPFNSEGELSLTSNKVGNVTVQMVVQLTMNNNVDGETNQTRYYTVTKVFAVGTEGTGDVVVLSIGSHQIVKNDEVKDIPAAAVIKDSRTFVPFRALGEAFGANVVWDEPTQSVIAELNGVKVVLTIGSTSYTVNGVEKVADVAPYIDGASTMVPVRFIATAFGIEPIVTQNPDGTTADILFLL